MALELVGAKNGPGAAAPAANFVSRLSAQPSTTWCRIKGPVVQTVGGRVARPERRGGRGPFPKQATPFEDSGRATRRSHSRSVALALGRSERLYSPDGAAHSRC